MITHFLFNKGGAGEGGGAIILAVEGVDITYGQVRNTTICSSHVFTDSNVFTDTNFFSIVFIVT